MYPDMSATNATYGVDIYQEDLDSLYSPSTTTTSGDCLWLRSNIIAYQLAKCQAEAQNYNQAEVSPSSSPLYFLDPSVAQCMYFFDDPSAGPLEEICVLSPITTTTTTSSSGLTNQTNTSTTHECLGSNIVGHKTLFIPITDYSVQGGSSSHWSSVVCHIEVHRRRRRRHPVADPHTKGQEPEGGEEEENVGIDHNNVDQIQDDDNQQDVKGGIGGDKKTAGVFFEIHLHTTHCDSYNQYNLSKAQDFVERILYKGLFGLCGDDDDDNDNDDEGGCMHLSADCPFVKYNRKHIFDDDASNLTTEAGTITAAPSVVLMHHSDGDVATMGSSPPSLSPSPSPSSSFSSPPRFVSSLQLRKDSNFPQQQNGYDCGMFVIEAARALLLSSANDDDKGYKPDETADGGGAGPTTRNSDGGWKRYMMAGTSTSSSITSRDMMSRRAALYDEIVKLQKRARRGREGGRK